MATPARVLVVGSINMDLVARVARLPQPGETVHGMDLVYSPGGKGANQAVAAARLGAATTLVGAVGDDAFGGQLLAGLREQSIETTYVQIVPRCSSGVALIGVEDSGENSITVIAGANHQWQLPDTARLDELIAGADLVLLQLEIPDVLVADVMESARRVGTLCLLDPAPAPTSFSSRLRGPDIISPNQTEAEALTGIPVRSVPEAETAARRLLEDGARCAVVKLGSLGALWLDDEGRSEHVAARSVDVVDTTAAGDAFTAALAIAIAEGREPCSALQFACTAGTLATQTAGAQAAMPTRAQVNNAL